jgi:hypothetical protein
MTEKDPETLFESFMALVLYMDVRMFSEYCPFCRVEVMCTTLWRLATSPSSGKKDRKEISTQTGLTGAEILQTYTVLPGSS